MARSHRQNLKQIIFLAVFFLFLSMVGLTLIFNVLSANEDTKIDHVIILPSKPMFKSRSIPALDQLFEELAPGARQVVKLRVEKHPGKVRVNLQTILVETGYVEFISDVGSLVFHGNRSVESLITDLERVETNDFVFPGDTPSVSIIVNSRDGEVAEAFLHVNVLAPDLTHTLQPIKVLSSDKDAWVVVFSVHLSRSFSGILRGWTIPFDK